MLKRLLRAPLAWALALFLYSSEVNSHTNSIGYVGEGAGAVTFWYGSWHSNTTFNEGSLQLVGANGTAYGPVVTPFNLFSPTVPTGLTAGTNWFQSNGTALVPYGQGTSVSYVYQGVRFTNLQPGQYTFTYIPLGNPLSYDPNGTPTLDWQPQDNVILSSDVTLTSAIISPPGTPPTLPPTPAYTGPGSTDTMNALIQLGNKQTMSYLIAQNSTLIALTDYDCTRFDNYNVCFSIASRYNSVSEHDSSFSGVIVAAWRPIQELRVGVWAEQAASSPSISGIDYRSNEPSWGVFAVAEENTNNTGFRLRTAYSRASSSLRITRDTIATSEPGYGTAAMNTVGYGAEVSYGFDIDNDWKVSPYTGLWRVATSREQYTESGASYPISYGRNDLNTTTLTAGLRFTGRLDQNLSTVVSAGIEKNISVNQDPLTGTSNIPLLENFSMTMPKLYESVRMAGSVGLVYDIEKDQSLIAQVSARQLPEIEAYATGRINITGMIKYQVAF